MIETEIAVVGAGPAGLTAACESAQAGSKVMVFDENNQPGGQLVNRFINSLVQRNIWPVPEVLI